MNDMKHKNRDHDQQATDPSAAAPGERRPPGGEVIRYVSFVRRMPDGSLGYAPADFPIEEMGTWEQVAELFGGGTYQAVAKDANHRVVRHYPGSDWWMSFAAEPKPMVWYPRRPTENTRASDPTGTASEEQGEHRQEPAPIQVTSDGNAVSVNGRILRVYVFRGRPCVLAEDLMRALECDVPDLALLLSVLSRANPHVGEVLTGSDLRELQAMMEVVCGAPVGPIAEVLVLYEEGIDFACEAAQTPTGARLRSTLIEEVMPQIGLSDPAAQPPPVPARDSKVPPERSFDPVRRNHPAESERRIASLEARVADLEMVLADLGVPPGRHA
jgi:hypothetical protein